MTSGAITSDAERGADAVDRPVPTHEEELFDISMTIAGVEHLRGVARHLLWHVPAFLSVRQRHAAGAPWCCSSRCRTPCLFRRHHHQTPPTAKAGSSIRLEDHRVQAQAHRASFWSLSLNHSSLHVVAALYRRENKPKLLPLLDPFDDGGEGVAQCGALSLNNNIIDAVSTQRPSTGGVHLRTTPATTKDYSESGLSAFAYVRLSEHSSSAQRSSARAAIRRHAAMTAYTNQPLTISVVTAGSLRGPILAQTNAALQSASILMAIAIPVVLMLSLQCVAVALATALSITWTIMFGVLSSEVMLRTSDRVCFTKILNVYFCVVTSTIVATFLSLKFYQLRKVVETSRFQQRWRTTRGTLDVTFLTIYPHMDLAYNSVCTLETCCLAVYSQAPSPTTWR